MRGSHDSPQHNGFDGEAPEQASIPTGEDAASSATLDRAAAGWLRRGYTLRYRDAHLVQLVRGGRPTWQGWLLIALAAPGLALAIALVVLGLRRRSWHTISITVTPDQRVVTHRQWTPYPPEEP